MNIEKIESMLEEKLQKHILSEITDSVSRDTNRASDLGVDCDTYHALCRLKGELRPRLTPDKKQLFRTGNIVELPNLTFLNQAGLPIQPAAQYYRWHKYKISGRTDGVAWLNIDGKKVEVPAEHKACSPNVFRSIVQHKTQGIPLTKSKYHWVRKYPAQLMIYMLQKGVEYGLWIFYDKVSGRFLFWVMSLDYDYAEELLKRAERANKNAEKNIIPEPRYKDICTSCDFALTHCFPDKDFGEGFDIISDEDLVEKLQRREELKTVAEEYQAIDKEIKTMFRGKNAVVGDFLIESKKYETTFYKVPDDVKKEFAQKREAFRTVIKKLGGKQ